jgi:YgiT-type zinc finger domain-containing protein
MRCLICKHGETRRGVASVALQKNGATIVVRSVPAQICDNCGE